jgi:VIT1/CCC1 family predicted Fe2+/Mn2+ transporter
MSALESWKEEQRAVYLYRVVAETEAGTPRRALFLELAQAAASQAEIWAREVQKAGGAVPAGYEPDARTLFVAWLVRRFGPRAVRGVLAAMKVRGMSVYSKASAPRAVPTDISQVGGRHRSAGSGGNLRAAVFGVNDGLLSNASLILGIAGANPDPQVILLAGTAGLLAGAFSMASGEYVSVRSQRELYEYQIDLERSELAEYPHEEAAELALIYEAKGINREEARHLADTLVQDPERALDTLAREELGLNPEELGSPWGAALFSFFSFTAGAAVPLLPFAIGVGERRLALAIGLTGISLFGIGALLSLFTGRGPVRGGLRMLLIGALAGAATFTIGKLVGVAVL